MSGIVPNALPDATRVEVISFITDSLPLPRFPFLVARRGYYGDSMGERGANDCNVYDDAIWLVEPDRMTAWNANCDPSKHRPGMATLKCGRWQYREGIHNISKPSPPHERYACLIQAEPVTVIRDGQGEDSGEFGIHVHKGGENTTSSEGCFTIPPGSQWNAFMPAYRLAMSRTPMRSATLIVTSRYP